MLFGFNFFPHQKSVALVAVIEAAISEWKETSSSKIELDEDIYSSVKSELVDDDEAFQVFSIYYYIII